MARNYGLVRPRSSRYRKRSRSSSSEKSPRHSSKHRSPRKKSHKERSSKRRHRSKSKDSKQKNKASDEEENVEESLEREMQKRRERVEQWRSSRKVLKQDASPSSSSSANMPPQKKINLENDDDDEDEEEDGIEKKEESKGDEVDPLDAFMMGLDEQLKQDIPNTKVETTGETEGAKVEKGELMEANMDALEYSEEEEVNDELDELCKSKKKEIPQVDHSKVAYATFRKNFYIEVPEVASMTAQEVAAYRKEMDDVTVAGSQPPKPIKSWAQCGFSRKVLEILKKNNFVTPTPIQAQSLPIIMSGRDMIGIAKTGSGKTLAFMLPMLRHVVDQPELKSGEGPIALMLTPTRELAMQIGVECRKFCKNLNLRCLCIYGGRPISEQIAELKRGAEMVVCTPGRMIDMLTANSGRVTNLRRCTYTVLDEADRMFDMGFEQQVLKIINNIRPDSQTVLFSATFPPKIENLARRILHKPFEVSVGKKSVVCADVEQHVMVIEDNFKFLKLLELLGLYQELGSVLVFVHKQEHADELMKNLMKQGYPCMSLHGGIDQFDRDSSMQDFKQGNIKLLITTSVCSRGLDVKDLILVLNYDCPNHYEDYVHRCGRTGRAGNRGYAYTFVSPDQGRYSGDIIKALKYSKVPVPEELQKLWDSYKQEAEAEGKQAKGSSGFKGKGFKFDETEAQLADDRRKLQKAALGLQDSDEEDAGVDIEEKIEQMFSSKKWVSDVAQSAKQSTDNATQLKLQQAMKAAENINKLISPPQQDIQQQTAAAIIKGGVAISHVSSKTIAEQMADRINAKLGYRPIAEETKDTSLVDEADSLRRFEEELEINDFPQTARWKVTSREALSQICEFSEAGITVRGSYFAPNKEPKEGDDRKLYLAIEASSERALNKAKSEVTRLIKEELVRLQNSYQPINRNRYKVV